MQSFEITIEGNVQSGTFATQAEADAAANKARESHTGKTILVRTRDVADPTIDPADPSQDATQPSPQGTVIAPTVSPSVPPQALPGTLRR